MIKRPRHSSFYVAKTLLGGEPDCNRRTIYAIDTEMPIRTFNQEMETWTPAMQAELERELKALNDLCGFGTLH